MFPDQNVVNLSLFRVDFNAAWRNQPLPSQGESAPPPLALNLDYLITAYGEDDHEDVAQFFLGQAMRVLHDHAVIPRARWQARCRSRTCRTRSNIRITPKSLSVEELSKIWTVAQTQHRLSAAYLVTVVLIDSRSPVRSPLPVLTRGKDDRGIEPSPPRRRRSTASPSPAASMPPSSAKTCS